MQNRTSHTVPLTSRLANDSVDKDILKTRIILALDTIGGYGSAEQIADYLGLDHVCINRRLSDLEKESKVIVSDYARKNKSGRLAYVYRLPEVTTIVFKVSA